MTKNIRTVTKSKKEHVCAYCKQNIPISRTYFVFHCGHGWLTYRGTHKYIPMEGYPKKCCWSCYPWESRLFMKKGRICQYI